MRRIPFRRPKVFGEGWPTREVELHNVRHRVDIPPNTPGILPPLAKAETAKAYTAEQKRLEQEGIDRMLPGGMCNLRGFPRKPWYW